MAGPANPVQALVVVGSGCPHCHLVLQGLSLLLAEGRIAALETVRVEEQPERVGRLGIRSLPWLRLGLFELEGALTLPQLRIWVARVGEMQGMAAYFDHLFSRGQRQKVAFMVRRQPELLQAFVHLLADPQVGINTRLGVGVVLEELADSGLAARIVHELGQVTLSPDPRLRGDACHYLPLTGTPLAIPYLEGRLADPHDQVREIARESLDGLLEQLAGCFPEKKGS